MITKFLKYVLALAKEVVGPTVLIEYTTVFGNVIIGNSFCVKLVQAWVYLQKVKFYGLKKIQMPNCTLLVDKPIIGTTG
jgi:hypothetical protein